MIKNFSIIAHIDAGKSTLADRLLEMTNTIDSRLLQEQFLDSNPIERERGITIKMAPVTMNYQDHTLNLIDTPGHVDFNYEVERALFACEGAIILIDATKGVQAQTVSNYHLAQKLKLKLLPVINKIDTPIADIPACQKQINTLFGYNTSPLQISAKTGLGVKELIDQIINQIPSPQITPNHKPLQALVFNSTYHPHLGVIAFIRLISGQIKTNDKLRFISNQSVFQAQEIGIFSPQRNPKNLLETGSVGYIVTGLKKLSDVQIGDTITNTSSNINLALPGFRRIKPNVFFDLFPIENTRYLELLNSLDKLKLNDSSLETKPIKSTILGQGLRVGFLGLLHSEVVCERLDREFNLPVIATSPSVEYQAILTNGSIVNFANAGDFPDPSQIKTTKEPVAKVNIVTPNDHLGKVLDVCQNLRGQLKNMSYLDRLVELEYKIPLIEVITSLHDQIKSVSSGYASVNYENFAWQETELVKLTVLLNHEEAPPLSIISPKTQALSRARILAARLKETIPRQQFEVPIQVAIGGQIIARETIKAFRKDVTAKLYGGDRTRRLKLLEKQKKGKARMKQIGQVSLPQEAFLAIVKT